MKYVFFNTGTDPVVNEVSAHIATLGYTPVFSEPDLDVSSPDALDTFITPYKNELTGAILSSPAFIPSDLESMTDTQWREARDTFPAAMLAMTQTFGRILARNNGGSLIYLNTIHADKPLGGGFLYTMGCAAVQILCREAAIVYGSRRVGCFNVMRGIVEGEESRFPTDYSPIYREGAVRFPDGVIPRANNLNGLCTFLLSGDAFSLNGSDLHADEGFRLYYVRPWFTDI